MRDHSFNEHQFFMIYHEYAESAIFIDDFMHAQQRHLDLLCGSNSTPRLRLYINIIWYMYCVFQPRLALCISSQSR